MRTRGSSATVTGAHSAARLGSAWGGCTPVAPEPKDELAHISINIEPGVDASGYQLPPITILDELPPAGSMQSNENTAENP